MTPRDRVLSKLRMSWPGTASYKECAAGLNHREDCDQVADAFEGLVAESLIEVASVKQISSWPRGSLLPVVGTRSRYRLVPAVEKYQPSRRQPHVEEHQP